MYIITERDSITVCTDFASDRNCGDIIPSSDAVKLNSKYCNLPHVNYENADRKLLHDSLEEYMDIKLDGIGNPLEFKAIMALEDIRNFTRTFYEMMSGSAFNTEGVVSTMEHTDLISSVEDLQDILDILINTQLPMNIKPAKS